MQLPLAEVAKLADLFAQYRIRRQNAEAAATAIDAEQLLWPRVIRFANGVPTQSEVVRYLAARQVTIETLSTNLNEASTRLNDERSYQAIHSFWTEARLVPLPEKVQDKIRVEVARPVSEYTRFGSFRYPISDIADALLHGFMDDKARDDLKSLRREWNAVREELNKTFPPAQRDACVPIVKASDLPAPDQRRMINNLELSVSRDQAYGYQEIVRDMSAEIKYLVDALRLNTLDLYAQGDEKTIGRFPKAVEYLQKHPNAVLETKYDRRMQRNGHDHFARMMADPSEEASQFLVLAEGELWELSNEDVLVRERTFRFVVDTLKLDPRVPPEFITRRTVSIGERQRPGHCFFYPKSGFCLVVCVAEGYSDPYPHVFVAKGTLDTAKTMIAERLDPVFGDGPMDSRFEDMDRLNKELDPADPSAPISPFVTQRFDMARIEAHYAFRAQCEAELQAL